MAASVLGLPRHWLDQWIRRRARSTPPVVLRYRQIFTLPTGFGWLLGMLMFAMLMGSLNFNNNLGLLTTFIVAGIALVSLLAAFRNLQGTAINRIRAKPVHAGDRLPLAIELAETAGRNRTGLVVTLADRSAAADLAADSVTSVVLEIPTSRRGRLQPGRLQIRTRHPLGLFEAWSWFWPGRDFLVWPRPAARPPPLPGGNVHSGSPRPGDESDEFHGLRSWREGDPLHRIAWKASQRHQHLLARQFTRHESPEIELCLEQAPGADVEEKIAIMAAWVLEAERRDLKYALDCGSTRLAPDRGDAHRVRCLDALAEHP